MIAELADDNSVANAYTFGNDLISQTDLSTSNTSYFHYDGQGNTRNLSDTNGLSDSYIFDAFGTLLNTSGSTDNDYLYSGEQFDAELDNYYLRARYYDQSVGRFTQMDTWMGRPKSPITLNKYIYADAEPLNKVDPAGNFSIASTMRTVDIAATLATRANAAVEVFSLATDSGDKVTPLEIGSGILLGMLPAASALKVMRLSNKRKQVHGNSKNSNKRQHLYRIDDVRDFDIYKYGISGGVLKKNGSSKRANSQANKLNNKVKAKRYLPVVMFNNLPNRLAALAAEKALVCAYNKANGRNPEGNKRPTCN